MGKLQQINKRATSIIVALGIVLSVVFGSYDTAKATGMEELFYYTYFDLMSGLFAETGMDFALKDDYYTKSDRVSGKQVWDNFCTWVENKSKIAALPVEVVNKTVFDELKNLPNTVTSAGAKMSEKLSELLAKVLPTFETDSSFSSLTQNSLLSFLHATSDYDILSSVSSYLDAFNRDLSNGYKVNVVKDGNEYFLFVSDPAYFNLQYIQDKSYSHPVFRCYGYKGNSLREIDVSRIYSSPSSKQVGVGAKIRATEPVWIIKEGNYVATDGTTLNDYATVKKAKENTVYVPGVGWKTEWEIWNDILDDRGATDKEKEEWWMRYHVNELLKDLPDSGGVDPDDEKRRKKDNEKDKLPVAIPIIPFKKPDSSDKDKDKDTEQSTEKTSASPIINPKTGNVIDPETGYDIDPETGKLIDPETGKLIDRDMSDTSSKLLKYGDIRKIFPFCIPFDIVDMIRGLRAEKAPPVFHFDYYFKGIDYTFTVDVDLSDYDKYIKLFRGGMVIFFVLALMWLTVKVSKFFS